MRLRNGQSIQMLSVSDWYLDQQELEHMISIDLVDMKKIKSKKISRKYFNNFLFNGSLWEILYNWVLKTWGY